MLNLLTLTLLTLTASAAAGPSITGGGKGVVCRTKSGAVKSVDLLDLWEARSIHGRAIKESKDPVAKQVKEAASRLKYAAEKMPGIDVDDGPESLAQEVLFHARHFLVANSPFLKRLKGASLTLTEDSFELARPQNCAVEQIVIYKDAGVEIFLNDDLFQKMSTTQQAALIVHEALYRQLRNFSEPNSIRTRRMVGYVFAGGTFPDIHQLLPKEHIACYAEGMTADNAYIYVFPGQTGGLQAIRTYTGGTHYLLDYTPTAFQTSRIDATNWKDLFSDRACGGSNANGPIDSALMWGKGPADYDGSSGMSFVCQNGKLNISFIDLDGNPKGLLKDKPLFCELVK